MTDPLDTLRELAPSVDDDPEILRRVRNDFMTSTNTPAHTQDTPPAHRRRWTLPLAAAVVLATAAAGWAVMGGDTSTTTNLSCRFQAQTETIVNARSGDPVQDCADEWRRQKDAEPPAMAAYDNGNGGVVVLLKTEPVPDGYTALEPGPHQNIALIELEATLTDLGQGLASSCRDASEARTFVEDELERVGLDEWTATVGFDRVPDGTSTCAGAEIHADDHSVALVARPAPESPDPFAQYARYARELQDQLAVGCLGLDEAADLTRTLSAATDIVVDGNPIDLTEGTGGALAIHTVDTPDAACTTATVEVGGTLAVTLRGPAN